MSTSTLTTNGVTNPSTTTRAYAGATAYQPPASGADLGFKTEATTAQYSAMAVEDSTYWDACLGSNGVYFGVQVELQLPSELRNVTITQLDYGMTFGASNYTTVGGKLYIRQNVTPVWEVIGQRTYGTVGLVSGSKTTGISNYVDSNYRVRLLLLSRSQYDDNGSTPYMRVSYVYVTVTYADAGGSSHSITVLASPVLNSPIVR